jgi:hypothetical protein
MAVRLGCSRTINIAEWLTVMGVQSPLLDWVLLLATLKMMKCDLEGKLVGKLIKKEQVTKCQKS